MNKVIHCVIFDITWDRRGDLGGGAELSLNLCLVHHNGTHFSTCLKDCTIKS